MTVAMALVEIGILPPKQWIHDPELKDYDNKNTVAM